MKYILKYNESVDQEFITQADFDLIEDLFLFLSDQGKQVEYQQLLLKANNHRVSKDLLNSRIENNCKAINLKLFSTRDQDEDRLVDRLEISDFSKGNFNFSDFKKIFDIKKKPNVSWVTNNTSYTIRNLENLTNFYGPFPEFPKTPIQKVLQKLDPEYNFKKDLVDILYRTKGLDHYGFKWEILLNCEFQMWGEYELYKTAPRVIIDVVIELIIKR